LNVVKLLKGDALMNQNQEELLLLRAIKKLRDQLKIEDSAELIKNYITLTDCLIHLRLNVIDERK